MVSKKKRSKTDFSAEIGNSNVFSAQNQVASNKKKKVLTEIETDFSAEIGNSNVFSAQNQVVSKKKRAFTEIETDFSAEIGNLNVSGGAVFLWGGGGYFQFFTKNRAQNQQKGAILHTSQANGRGSSPPPAPPGYATGTEVSLIRFEEILGSQQRTTLSSKFS